MARTRSSRLFVVLLHLVGVSTDIPNNWKHNPLAIVLEKVQLRHDGLEGIIRYTQQQQQLSFLEDDALSQPFWLQDEVDGLCLGPIGFSQCGEATLWHVRDPSSNTMSKRRRRRRSSSATDLGYAFQYFQPTQDGQCLQYKSINSNNNNNNNPQKPFSKAMGSCHASLDRVFAWKVNGQGVLHRDDDSSSAKRLLAAAAQQSKSSSQCLCRGENDETILAPCNPDAKKRGSNTEQQQRVAHLSIVRYQPASVVQERNNRIVAYELELAANATKAAANRTTTKNDQPKVVIEDPVVIVEEQQQHIPRSKDRARNHASQPMQHAEVKSSKKRMGSVTASSVVPTEEQQQPKRSFFTLQDTNPILFHGDSLQQAALKKKQQQSKSTSSNLVHSSEDAASYKLRRLETHPYIAASKDEMWIDPQTNLEYHTDLCRYLGHERKEAGRHTLAGIGYYTKTVLNIKVYGVALYVSKRDVLADPTFEQYAHMSSTELRANPDFYAHLREMPSPHDPNAGLVDRTIFLKLNMQLSVETMQSSLKATWKLLTEERKNLLIHSSMRPRPAEERMLRTISSPENTGRCSCGQIAPPEYNADKQCCARGTELVFTWRKNGDLEIRLDGRVMDTFDRPDVARGIFYEYLRTDDPIAADFSQHVVDGFPFLLGPLAQVKGMPQAIQMNSDAIPNEKGFGKAVGNFADMMGSHAGEFAGWVHHGTSNVANVAKTIGATAKSVGDGLDRRRDTLWNQVSALPENSKHFIQRRLNRGGRPDELAASVSHYMKRRRRGEIQMKRRAGPRGRVFRSSVNQWFGSENEADDIVSTVANPQNTFFGRIIFLYMSHLYLLLLLIVSLPGTHHTKYVYRRAAKASSDSISADDASTESSSADEATWTIGRPRLSRIRERRRPPPTGMKKSLSYYL